MKGVLFNVVEDVVTEAMSADAWDHVIERAGVDGAYTSLGDYPDGELLKLVESTSRAASLTTDDTLRLAGRNGFKHLVRRAPRLLEGLDDWRSVLASLDEIIHPEVRKIYPDAKVPRFDTEARDGAMLLHYQSERGLCVLAEGMVLGTGDWFDTPIAVEHVKCIHRGDSSCLMRVTELKDRA